MQGLNSQQGSNASDHPHTHAGQTAINCNTITSAMFETALCLGTAIDLATNQGVEQALLEFPELLQLRPLLEEIVEVDQQLTHQERLAADLSTRLDELGAVLAARVEGAA